MSDSEQIPDGEPPCIDPYSVLSLDHEATAQQIKSAYRKAALNNHPDKVPHDQKEAAHSKFQDIAFAYAVLSDPVRRKRYDATGSTAESIIDSDDFNWSDFYRQQFKDAVSASAIEQFAAKYKGSEEEKDDVLIAYENGQGDMDHVFEHVKLSNAADDDTRFRQMIDEAIESGRVQAYAAYAKESKKKRRARVKAAAAEADEAEAHAKKLGVHDKLFGDKKKKGNSPNSEDQLAALIRKRHQDQSSSFLDNLAEKYGAGGSKSTKGAKGAKGQKRKPIDPEPSEEAFQAAAAKLGKKGGDSPSESKRSRRSK